MKTPLYIILKNYRVLAITIIVFFAYLTMDMWHWYKGNHSTFTPESASVFASLVLLAGGALKFALENIMRKHEKDDDHE